MPNLLFSLPYNNDPRLLEGYKLLQGFNGNKIEEIYFSGPQSVFGSGRIVEKTELGDIIPAINFCLENGIKSNLLLNSTCEGADWHSQAKVSKVIRMIEDLHEKHGLDIVTIANPLYIQKIRKYFPKIKINASVLCQISSAQKAIFFEKFGCDYLTLDPDINRDLNRLSEIKSSVRCSLKLMANEGCLFQCPCRSFHFNMTSHQSKIKKDRDAFFPICHALKMEKENVLRSPWVRPEDLKKYQLITTHFKLTDRKLPTEDLLKISNAFMSEKYSGNLLDIIPGLGNHGLSLDNEQIGNADFFRRVTTCDRVCQNCKYCSGLSEKYVHFKA